LKFSYRRLANRIDDMTLRERGLTFAAAVMTLVALPYTLIIDPALATQKRMLDQIKKDQSQINALGTEMSKLVEQQSEAPSAVNQEKLRALDTRLAEIEREINATRNQLVPADRISDLLRGLMAKTGRVTLVSLNAVSGTPAVDSGTAARQGAAGTTAAPAAPTAPAGAQATAESTPPIFDIPLYRRGVELTVRGNYLDLVQFLADLEKMPWRMLWGKSDFEVERYPLVTLKVQLYTLSSDRAAVTL
jgi:MSHA biogenesis protein MshJ